MAMIAVIIFVFTLLGGATLAVLRVRRMEIPKLLPPAHGLLGLSGIAVLIGEAIRFGPAPSLLASLGLFLGAALAGVYLANAHRNRKGSTAIFISAHASMAVFGFIMLLVYTFGDPIAPVGG